MNKIMKIVFKPSLSPFFFVACFVASDIDSWLYWALSGVVICTASVVMEEKYKD